MAIYRESQIHDIMTLLRAGNGRMAIYRESQIHDIMTLLRAGNGRMAIYHKLQGNLCLDLKIGGDKMWMKKS